MDFRLTDEQELLRRTVRDFAETEIRPHVREWDEAQHFPAELIPALAAHKKNAELIMNYYYDPKIAAEVAAYVQYISPVAGAQEAMAAIDPALVENQWIFPDTATLDNSFVFMTLTAEQDIAYQRAFQKAIGN